MAESRAKQKLFQLIDNMNGEDTLPMQYGGGLDDAYMDMSRRKSNAFADPNANTAFDSPMSQGGLPTIYRDEGGPMAEETYAGAGNFSAADAADAAYDAVYNDNIFESFDPPTAPAPTTGGAGPDIPDWTVLPDDKGNLGVVGPTGEVQIQLNEDLESGYYREPGFFERLFNAKTDKKGQMFDKDETLRGQSYDRYMKDWDESIPSNLVPYYNELKSRGMTNDDATSMLARAASTPGGLAALQAGSGSGYSYGGPMGTLQDILETGMAARFGISDLIKDDPKKREWDEEERQREVDSGDGVSREDLNKSGISGNIIDTIKDFFGAGKAEDMSPRTIMSINNILAKEGSGATYSPPDGGGVIGKLINFAAPFPAKLAFNALTRGNRGSITTKDGMTFNIDKDGRFTYANLPDADIDYGNEPTPVKRRRPVQQAKASPVVEPEKTGMAALLAKRRKPTDRLELADNISGQDKFKKIYGRNYRTV